MKLGSVAIAYREERFIEPHLKHLQVDEKLVLNSTQPWFGEPSTDMTARIAEPHARVIHNYWPTEAAQRNTGQALHHDKDWVIILDPDEFLDNENWEKLKTFLSTAEGDAYTCEQQNTYWKNRWVATPPEGHRQTIAVRPWVQFVDKRTVDRQAEPAPVTVEHFSWARTDDEVYRKISHYAHHHDFDTDEWFDNVWLKWRPGDKDVHPVNPESLHDFKRAELAPELERLNLWP